MNLRKMILDTFTINMLQLDVIKEKNVVKIASITQNLEETSILHTLSPQSNLQTP